MTTDDPRARSMAQAAAALPPLEALAKFLRTYFSDAGDLAEVRRHLARSVAVNPRPVLHGLAGIEGTLADPPPAGTLAQLVAWEGNWPLDDAGDEAAAAWLREVAAMAREVLGPAAPPA